METVFQKSQLQTKIWKSRGDRWHGYKENVKSSLESGESPEVTAQAIATPVYKDGVKSNPASYWSVTLTNRLTKIFERILKWSVVEYLGYSEVMNQTQNGFRHKGLTVVRY